MIYGIGTDIVESARIAQSLDRYGERFARRILTDSEWQEYVINRLCSPSDQFCRIRFWSEERFVPETAALTVEQNKQLRADYLVNKTAGMHHLRWSCTVDPDKTHCF